MKATIVFNGLTVSSQIMTIVLAHPARHVNSGDWLVSPVRKRDENA